MMPAQGPDVAEQAEEQLRQAVQAGEVLQAQLQGLEEQVAFVNAMTQEIQAARATLDALLQAKQGDAMLLPIGGGAFVPAQLAQADRVLYSIGSGLHAEGTLRDAIARMDEQMERARESGRRLQEEAARVTEQLQAVEAHLAQMTR